MSKYIVNITYYNLTDHPYGYNQVTLYIKIDINGNIDIKQMVQDIQIIHDYLIINDNIPIPTYMINMIKHLFPDNKNTNSLVHFLNIIESIKILKNDIQNSDAHLIDIIDSESNLNNNLIDLA